MVLVLIETLVNRTPYLGSILLHPPTVSCLRSCGGWFGGELGLEPRKTPRLVAPLECTVWGNNYPDKRHFTPKVTLFKPRFDYIIAL